MNFPNAKSGLLNRSIKVSLFDPTFFNKGFLKLQV
uniref:Uncharacterized protein n=1 Tax=Rhizophora mucronata TaxID=61149 RepID=A0A2P2INF1_RHIMU